MLTWLKRIYKRYLFKTPLTPLIYGVLDGAVNLECQIKHFWMPDVYLRAWKLDMLRERYEKSTTDLFKKIIKPGMIIVDIGGHVGYYTRLFSRLTGRAGRVFSFEPDPFNFALLQKNAAVLKNTSIHQLALSDHSGTIDFFHSEVKTGCHSTIPSPLRQTKLTVQAALLDEVALKQNITRVDVIKMDIEGGEPAALRGMAKLLTANPQLKLVTEFNPQCFSEAGMDPMDFIRQIEALGFKISAIRQNGGLEPVSANMTEQQITGGQSFVNILCHRDAI